jgi:hypothetical protein
MFGPSFLGLRGSGLIDIGILAIVVVAPALIWSWGLARRRQLQLHKRVQLTLGAVLGVVVLLFELDIRNRGGVFAVVQGSAYEGTSLLAFWIWFHFAFALSATVIWLFLIIASLIRFPSPPEPAAFPTHKYFGRAGMVAMLGAGVTAIPMYYYGFMV